MAYPSIKYESSLLAKNELDIDNLRRKYVKKDADIGVYFVSPYLLGYEKYRQYLLKNSILESLNISYFYRPDYLSFDLYGSTIFWSILLFINNIPCIEEFNVDNIYIPTFDAITLLSNLKENENAVIDLDQVASAQPIWPKLYQPTDRSKVDSEPIETPSLSLAPYKRDQFVINANDLANEYVILTAEPLVESVVVRLQDQIVVPLYGVHYIVKYNDTLLKYLISWSDADTPSGRGMTNIVLLNTVMEVQYQVSGVTT
jgi:hypothetical protein